MDRAVRHWQENAALRRRAAEALGGPARSGAGRADKAWPGFKRKVAFVLGNRLAWPERAADARRVEELSRRLSRIQDSERRRLSAELHERTSANLAAVQIGLATFARRLPPRIDDAAMSELQDLAALVDDIATAVRETCTELRPAVLDYAGLVPALQGYARYFARQTGICIRVDGDGTARCLPAGVECALFRIAQEALANCVRHAAATMVEVKLSASADTILMTIADNGVGFDLASLARNPEPGLGLITMRERARAVGGYFSVDTRPGAGTRIRVEIGKPAG